MMNMNQLVYGILGATLADRKNNDDEPLSKNARLRIALLSSLGGGPSPMFTLLIANFMAEKEIKANTAIADSDQSRNQLGAYRDAARTAAGLAHQNDTAGLVNAINGTFDVNGNLIVATH